MSSYNNPSLFKFEPKRKEFSTREQRRETYVNWTVDFVDVNDLVEAGLYYLGDKDRVRCYFCGGGLRDWMPGDVPVVEHRKLFPSCGYLQTLDRQQEMMKENKTKSHSKL